MAAKTLGPSQVLEFMGIVIDSNRMEAWLPEDKLTRIKQLLNSFTNCRSARLVDLQSLVGTLQLACVQTSSISFHPRKRNVCETASLIVFQYPAVRVLNFA